MGAILDAFTHGKHLVTVFTTSDRMSKLPERRLFSRVPYEFARGEPNDGQTGAVIG
jgi:hypothetical protein